MKMRSKILCLSIIDRGASRVLICANFHEFHESRMFFCYKIFFCDEIHSWRREMESAAKSSSANDDPLSLQAKQIYVSLVVC